MPHDHTDSHIALPAGFVFARCRVEHVSGLDQHLDGCVAIREWPPSGIAGRFQGCTVGTLIACLTGACERALQWLWKKHHCSHDLGTQPCKAA